MRREWRAHRRNVRAIAAPEPGQHAQSDSAPPGLLGNPLGPWVPAQPVLSKQTLRRSADIPVRSNVRPRGAARIYGALANFRNWSSVMMAMPNGLPNDSRSESRVM